MSAPPTLTKPMDFPALATNCEASADYYEQFPGVAAGAVHAVVVDLYRTISLLARMTDRNAPNALGLLAVLTKHRQAMMDLLPEEVFAEISDAIRKQTT